MILSSKYEMQTKLNVIDLLGVKIFRGGQNIVRYFDPWVKLGWLLAVSK